MVKLQSLSCCEGNFLLSDINLHMEKGEYFTILGPTGSGKTILLECIAGLRKITEGTIYFKGKDISHIPPEKRNFAYVPQDFVLFPFLNVFENILFGMKNVDKVKAKVNEFAEIFRIKELFQRKPEELSGGEKQRVAIVRALVRESELLLLDEPYSSIDESLRKKLWFEMREIHNRFGTTVIHITHDLEEAYTLSDKIAVLIDGRIEQEALKDDVFYNPVNKTVASFMGFRNILNGRIKEIDKEDNKMVIALECYEVITPFFEGFKLGDKVEFCVLPQEIKILRDGREIRESLKDNVFSGRIENVIPHGVSHTIYFKIKGEGETTEQYDFEINIPYYNFLRLNLAVGSSIRVAMRKNAIKVFPTGK
ncbi:MAG: ABC transporter ATP-binding protein [Candidatus Schekmanbacteria bacterium]|nr:MAG: ABC transporter ATP-binding protein [Candidatus Schekmanbacteria bacterium]